jgi:PTH1 family peptidyl-tRNA hydrolase
MYLIVGLGNPEPEYSNTRHNMGFDVINKLAQQLKINVTKNKFNALYGSGSINNQKVILIKPQTYMNLSGQAVREFRNFYKIENCQIIIIYDDMDIEKGKIKIRKKGSAGSHNGMKSIIQELSTSEFTRIRIGIGKPEYKNDMINYVLEQIRKEERVILDEGIEDAKSAVIEMVKNGVDIAMNKYN